MEKTMNCYVASLWQNAEDFNNRNLVVVDYSPVVYSCGEGLYCVKGYIGAIDDNWCSVIINSNFGIQTGSHPMDDDAVICDGIKNAISNVISKTLAIVQMETGCKLNVIVDDAKLSEVTPPQLVEINNWIKRKLIIDHNGSNNDEQYNPGKYFTETQISSLTTFVTSHDKFVDTGIKIVDQLNEMLDDIMIDFDFQPYIHECNESLHETIDFDFQPYIHECNESLHEMIDRLQAFKTRLDQMSK